MLNNFPEIHGFQVDYIICLNYLSYQVSVVKMLNKDRTYNILSVLLYVIVSTSNKYNIHTLKTP